MKQGFVTAIMEQYSFEEVVDFASQNGFECLEVACWPKARSERRYAGVTHIDVDLLDENRKNEILQYCEKKHIEISALAYYPNILDPDMQKREFCIEHLKKVIRAAQMLNVNLVTTFIGRIPYKGIEENMEVAERIWKPILSYAEERKVRIAIENCPMLFTEDEWPGGKNLAISPAIWRELFRRLPSPFLGLNYDPSHFIWQEMNYIKPIYEFADKIFHVHYKDIKLNREARDEVGVLAAPLTYMSPKIPGHGDIDWGEYITALMEIGYCGAACVEIEDKAFEDCKENIEAALKISRAYLKQYIMYPEVREECRN